MSSFEGKIAVVTGGASGIGLALGEELALRGANVVLTDRDEKRLQPAAEAIAAHGGKFLALPLDVTDANAVRQVIADVKARHGRIDYLFNNAGVTVGGEAFDLDGGEWGRVLDIDLFGVIHGVRAAYPIMVEQGFGHIVNVSSLSGLVPSPFQVPYITSKFAVVGLSMALRSEARGLGVRVSVVCPGVIDTPILKTTPIVGMDRERVFRLFPKGISPDACARKILRAVERNQGLIVVTALARAMWLLYRISPELSGFVGSIAMRKIRSMRAPDDHRSPSAVAASPMKLNLHQSIPPSEPEADHIQSRER